MWYTRDSSLLLRIWRLVCAEGPRARRFEEPAGQCLPSRTSCRATAWRVLLPLVLLFAGPPQAALAQAVRTNPGFTSTSLEANDDGSFPDPVPLGFTVNFFGFTDNTVFVNNNGNITFDDPLATFTPEGLAASPLRIIAPFWGDVDTRGAGSSLVTFGQDVVNGRPAFGVNYVNVGYFASHDDKLNSFQVVLIDRSDIAPGDFDIEFNYDRIVWETGDASGGSGGLGGVSASAGYSNGEGTPEGSFEILGSRVNGLFLDSNRNGLIHRRLNSDVRGRLVFFVRSGQVDCTFATLSIDEPFPAEGGTGAVQVAAPGTCEWTAVSNASFISIVGESTRSGSATVEYAVAENRSRARSGTLLVAGETITVTQDGFITLKVDPPALNISAVDGRFPTRLVLQVEALRDPVEWAATVQILDGTGWRLRVSPESGTATESEPSTLMLEVENGFLMPLPTLASITVRDVINGPLVEVPVILAMSQLGPRLQLSQSAFVFRAAEGGPAPPAQTLRVLNSGQGVLEWSISGDEVGLTPWLQLTSLGGTAVPGLTIPSSTELMVDPAGLSAGVYQALLAVSASGAFNNPQLVSVTLEVAPGSTEPLGGVSPSGMVFVWQQGRPAPATQDLFVSNLGAGDVTFQLIPLTESGGNWLTISQTTGSTGGGPATTQVGVNPVGLATGLYRGSITAEFSGGAAQEVQVLLAVVPPPGNPLLGGNGCAAEGMDLVAMTVGNGARLFATFPVPLLAQVVDSCGRGVNDASLLFDVQETTVTLQPQGNGLYSGLWTPVLPAESLSLTFTALHPNLATAQRTFTVSVADAAAELSLPTITTDGVVEAAGLTPFWPLSPGGIISVFGSGLAAEEASATTIPLPRELAGVSLRIGNEDAPLFFVNPGRIDAQVPYSVRAGDGVSLAVRSGGRFSAPQSYLVIAVRPGIFISSGTTEAFDGQFNPITFQNPARIGEVLHIHAAGLGLVDPPAETGAAAPPSSTVHHPVTVTIGGVEVPVFYQGLVPGAVGRYRVSVGLRSDVPTGDEVPVTILQNGVVSNPGLPTTIPVRRPGE